MNELKVGQEYNLQPEAWQESHRFILVDKKNDDCWLILWQYTKDFEAYGYRQDDYHHYDDRVFRRWIKEGSMTLIKPDIPPVVLPDELFTL